MATKQSPAQQSAEVPIVVEEQEYFQSKLVLTRKVSLDAIFREAKMTNFCSTFFR